MVRGSSVAGKGALAALRDAVMPRTSPRVQAVNQQVDRMSKAEGGVVDGTLHSFKDDSQLNSEHGPSGGLRPGFTRGGYAGRDAKGGWIKGAIKHPGAFTAKAKKAGMSTQAYASKVTKAGSHATTQTKRQANLAKTLGRLPKASGGAVNSGRPMMQQVAKQALAKHIATPAPKGHKGLKSC
jgi:hypothetical protein